jgi:hypothetical protein
MILLQDPLGIKMLSCYYKSYIQLSQILIFLFNFV